MSETFETFIISQLAGGHNVPESVGWQQYELNWTAWQNYKDTYKIEGITIEYTQRQPVDVNVWIKNSGSNVTVGHLQDWAGGTKTQPIPNINPPNWNLDDVVQYIEANPNGKFIFFVSAVGYDIFLQNIKLIFTCSIKEQVSPSTVVVQTVTAGEPQTVFLTNAAATANHTVTWSYDGKDANGNNVTISKTDNYDAATRAPAWAIPGESQENLYRGFTSSKTATGTVTVTTKKSTGQSVGTTSYTATQNLPSSIGPTISNVTITPSYDSVGTASGETYLQNHTSLSFSVTYDVNHYNATLGSISVTTPDGTISDQSQSIAITKSGSYDITVKVTDSRGFTATNTQTINVTPCTGPTITSFSAVRCDSAGNENDEGTYLLVNISATIASVASSVSYKVQWKQTSASGYNTAVSFTPGQAVNAQMDPLKSYNIKVTATDDLTQATTITSTIASASYAIYRMAGGNGVAFGKVSELYGVEVKPSWPFYAHGKEIETLIMDIAHPIGSTIIFADASFDPNTSFPGTQWGLAETTTINNTTFYFWLRGR